MAEKHPRLLAYAMSRSQKSIKASNRDMQPKHDQALDEMDSG